MVWNWTFMILYNVYFWNEEFTLVYFVTKLMIMFTAISLFLSKLIILGAGLSAINLIPIFFHMDEVCKSHSDPTMGLLIFFPLLLQLSLLFGSLSLYLSTLLLCSSTCLLLLPSSVRAVKPYGGKENIFLLYQLKSSFHLVVTLLRCRQVQHALVEPPFVNSLWKCSRFHIRLRDGKCGRNQLLRREGWPMLKSKEFSSRKVLNESRNFQNKKHRESEKQIEILLKALFLATE